mgnify:CR=1 FL=1
MPALLEFTDEAEYEDCRQRNYPEDQSIPAAPHGGASGLVKIDDKFDYTLLYEVERFGKSTD